MYQIATRMPIEAMICGHAADTDAPVESRHGDLVGLVQHGRNRSGRLIAQIDGERIALHRVDRHVNTHGLQQARRVAAERYDTSIGPQALATRLSHGNEAPTLYLEAFDRGAKTKLHAEACRA